MAYKRFLLDFLPVTLKIVLSERHNSWQKLFEYSASVKKIDFQGQKLYMQNLACMGLCGFSFSGEGVNSFYQILKGVRAPIKKPQRTMIHSNFSPVPVQIFPWR